MAVLLIVATFRLFFPGLARVPAILAWWYRPPPAVMRAGLEAVVAFDRFALWAVPT
ncbi:MAG: hypothetical protein U1F76_23525 [Candidatus Competibacteraceae bacterium]